MHKSIIHSHLQVIGQLISCNGLVLLYELLHGQQVPFNFLHFLCWRIVDDGFEQSSSGAWRSGLVPLHDQPNGFQPIAILDAVADPESVLLCATDECGKELHSEVLNTASTISPTLLEIVSLQLLAH